MSYDGSWDADFPPVMHFVDLENACAKPWKFLEAHPDYDAAKNHEDRIAALRLVHDFLRTPENQAQLLTLKQKYCGAIIVPVRAIEAGGKNRIPEALAEYIGMNTNLEVEDNIIQTNRVHRTGTDEWHRFAFRPSYDGIVKNGRNYLIVDDVFSLGGSFNELRRFIEANGGKAVRTISLATGRSGPEIALNPKTLKDLVDRYGANKLELFLKEIDLYGGNYKALTEPEARALRRAPSLDEARDRIFAARCQGRPSVVSAGVQETQSQTSAITNQDNNPRRGLRR
jgi:hypothetical protein